MDREIPKSEKQKLRRRRIVTAAAITAVVLGGIALVITGARKSVKASDLRISMVETGTIETSVSASGKVVPAFEEMIPSPVDTRILEVYRQSGDSVEAGAPLIRLDLTGTETELNNLRDQLRMKQLELERTHLNIDTYLHNLTMQISVKEMSVSKLEAELANERRLDSLGSGTGDRVREAEFALRTGTLELAQLRQQLANERQVKAAEAEEKALELSILAKNVGEMERTLSDARILAPHDATLTYINNEIGAQVRKGDKVAVISDLSHFRVDAEIADSYGDKVAPGAPAEVRVGRETLHGHVETVTPLSRNGVISFTVALDSADHPRLRSGLKTDVYVMSGIKEDVMRIATGAYYMGPNDYELFVVDGDSRLTRRRVRLGDSNYQWVEVTDGLRPGDRVVVSDMTDYRNNNNLTLK